MKYLLIAIFLAGVNPKDTDPMKFVGDEFNRRKKTRRGQDNNNNNNNNNNLSNSLKRKFDYIQYFTLERL